MNTLIILRGLPGSGKSYLANLLSIEIRQETKQYPAIINCDDFFMLGGKYYFDAEQLGYAHETCRRRCELAMKREHPYIIIDNTNTTFNEIHPYAILAIKYNYNIQIKTPKTEWCNNINKCIQKNIHGVPAYTIEAMKARYENTDSILAKIKQLAIKP